MNVNKNALADIQPVEDVRDINRVRRSWGMVPRAKIELRVPPRKALTQWGGISPVTARHNKYEMWIADRMSYAVLLLGESVEVDHDVRSGLPVIRGTRVPLSRVLAEIAEGNTIAEIADDLEIDAGSVCKFIEGFSVLMDRSFK